MNNKSSFEGLLVNIKLLIMRLNYSDLTKAYEFEKVEVRNKKI